MNTAIIILKTQTMVMKAKRLLEKKKISTKAVKLDFSDTDGSCTHAIEISTADLYSAAMILREEGFEYRIINRKDGSF